MFWRRKKKILLVEDNINNHDLYREVFTQAGFEVLICQNAEDDFVCEVVAFLPDIISMDVMIAKVGSPDARDGFEAIELLHSDNRTKDIPVFILSNFLQPEKLERAKDLKVFDYFNLQGQSLPAVAEAAKRYLKSPRKYRPTQESLRVV